MNSADTGDAGDAFKIALKILSYRARSEAELIALLQRKGFSESVTRQTVARLRELRYTDDGIFAQDWARARAAGRGFGPRRIELELQQKGVAADHIRSAIRDAFHDLDESAQAKQALQKRFRDRELDDPRTSRQAAAFLQRRGYDHSVIYKLLRRCED